MSGAFRVGGVPEHFNLPWYRAGERGVFGDGDGGLDYSWRTYPGGTGQMLAALEADEIDVAVLLTEGVVAHIAGGGDAQILGTFVESPLIWGIHVLASSRFESVGDLEGASFAVSRLRSGSHIMAYVLAEQQGWLGGEIGAEQALRFEIVGDLAGARVALGEGRGDGFMWEKFMTKPIVDAGEWRRVGECPTPWAPFVVVSKRGFAAERAGDIGLVFERVRGLCEEMVAEVEATVEDISVRFGQRPEDVREWLSGTRWACAQEVDGEMIESVEKTLRAVGVIGGG